MRFKGLSLVALTTAASFAGAGAAAAAGFMIRENSAESVATVFAGNGSRAEDVSTVFNNPAGMVRLRGPQFEMGGAAVFPSIKFKGSSTVMGIPLPGDNSENAGQSAVAPHVYGKFDLTDRLQAGIALTVPFGNTVSYKENWSGRYVNLKTAATAIDINPNISYAVTDRLSIGGGVSAQYLKLEITSAIPQFAIFSADVPDGKYGLKVDGWAWGFNLGALAEPWDGTRIGVTYRSKIVHELEGDLTFSQDTSPLLGLVNSPAQTDINLPWTAGASITQDVAPNFSLSADVQFTKWDTFREVTAHSNNPPFTFEERYRDSWMLSAGGVYRLDPVWTLRGGVGFDMSPVTDAYRDTGVPDKSRYMIGAGFGYQFSPFTSLDVGYAHYFAIGKASMDQSVNRVEPLTHAIFLNGHYNNNLDYLALTIRTAL